jgi:hypothetical protein
MRWPMRLMRLVAGPLAGALFLAGSVSPAFAGETWCDVDPAVLLITPGGHLVAVYVVDAGPIQHTTSLLAPRITATTRAAQGGTATDVTLDIVVPNDLLGSGYAVSSEVWSGPARLGTRYAQQSGFAGQTMQLRFRLDIS